MTCPDSCTICYVTSTSAVKELARLTELALVIGAPNSSNCNRLGRSPAHRQGLSIVRVQALSDSGCTR